MKVIVTGSSGFVGQNLLTYIKNSFDVKILSRNELQSISEISFEGVSSIIHLAGKSHDLKKTTDAKEYYNVNYQITKELYDSFLLSNAEKFIFISSVKAVADSVNGVLTEDHLPYPQTHYGKSKLMAEQYIQSRPLPNGKSYYILRPCMIHGPGNKGNLNLLYKFIEKGIPYPFGGFDNKRSFLSIGNLCFIINNLISKDDIESGIYHVADDIALSTSQIVSMISSSLGKKERLWKIKPGFVIFLAKLGDKFHLPLTSERLKKLTENYLVSNVKIKKSINENLPLSSVEGLKITIESFNRS